MNKARSPLRVSEAGSGEREKLGKEQRRSFPPAGQERQQVGDCGNSPTRTSQEGQAERPRDILEGVGGVYRHQINARVGCLEHGQVVRVRLRTGGTGRIAAMPD
jgi:hypothetical protein